MRGRKVKSGPKYLLVQGVKFLPPEKLEENCPRVKFFEPIPILAYPQTRSPPNWYIPNLHILNWHIFCGIENLSS